jgi:hypothetical protein
MMTLHQAQALHVKLVASLIKFAYASGFELTWGEAYRTPEQAAWDAQNHTGIVNSVHCDRLAVDLQLFKDGAYLTDPEAYKFMADYWVSLDPSCRAGYFFTTKDANHFSITWQGRS